MGSNIALIMVSIMIVFVIFVVILIKIAMKREKEIYDNGIEVESLVSKVERYLDSDGDTRYRCYVKYRGDDCLEHEGLLNVRTNLPIGRKVQIKYLPNKYDTVVFVSQEL